MGRAAGGDALGAAEGTKELRKRGKEGAGRRLLKKVDARSIGVWNVENLMSGGVVTRSWEKERLSEEWGPIWHLGRTL